VSIITLTTDFGPGSSYAAALKGVILSINPAATIVDITHDIRPQDVRQGAVVLDDVCNRFPPDSIHVVVVDPGVGTDRAIVYAQIGRQHYVAPDNGLLCRLAEKTPPTKIFVLTNDEYWLNPVSSTFHGRDIMAPVAAHLSLGLDPCLLGPKSQTLVGLKWPEVVVKPDRIVGQILEIDSFGNLITNITSDLLIGRPTDERACVICSIYETWGIYGTYGDQLQGMFVAVVGSSNRIELAVVGDNAADRLGVRVGMPVTIAWG
jgi:S-adenosylmethionine hydrolase